MKESKERFDVSWLRKIFPEERFSTDLVDRISYSHDYWPISLHWMIRGKVPALPDVVVWPESEEEVSRLLKEAYSRRIPLYPYGGGSGVLGGTLPVKGGIVVDLKRMRKIEIFEEDLMAFAEAGVNGAYLEGYLNYHGYTLGQIPQSLYSSTLGGWIATKAIGQFSTKYGGIEDMVIGIRAVIPPGTVVSLKPVPRTSTGPDLRKIFIGSEGTLGVVTSAFLRIWEFPKKRIFLSYLSKDLSSSLEAVRRILRRGARPAVIRIYDKLESLRHFYWLDPEGCVTVIIVEGDEELSRAEEKIVREEFSGAIDLGEEPVKHWLSTRFCVKEASEFAPLGFVFDTIEVAIGWSKSLDLYEKMIKSMKAVKGTLFASAHASHFYPQGVCFYFTFAGIPPRGKSECEYYLEVWKAAMETVLRIGGTISHHHGVGRLRKEWLSKELGEGGFELLKKIKGGVDPEGLMNPGDMGL